jgi:Rieske Fe-S protein
VMVVQRKGIFRCPGHGAAFTSDGAVTRGPAKSSLAHLAIELQTDGHLIVDPCRKFPKDQWNAPGSFVEVK